MSDLASESTVAALAHAMARDGGFRPLQFGQPRSAPLAPVAEADKARTLWVNPADAVLLVDAPIALPIESDPSMARGTVRVETSAGWIEHGRAVYLDELRAALGSQGAAA